jgi:hypothetical protein
MGGEWLEWRVNGCVMACPGLNAQRRHRRAPTAQGRNGNCGIEEAGSGGRRWGSGVVVVPVRRDGGFDGERE